MNAWSTFNTLSDCMSWKVPWYFQDNNLFVIIDNANQDDSVKCVFSLFINNSTKKK